MEKQYLIQKWLNEDLTPDEKLAFDALDDVDLNKAIVDYGQHFKASHFSKPYTFEELEKKIDNPKTPVRSLSWNKIMLQVASVVVLGFVAYYGFFSNRATTFDTAVAEKISFTLPDASEVTLNAASEIRYNKKDWANNRSLTLHGEAYFKVAKGKKFDVETSDGIVSVLGTQFNVKQRDSYFEVTCYEGVVRVTTNDTIKTLVAGNSFVINNGRFTSANVSDTSPRWTAKSSTFSSVELFRVLNELERQYGVTITYTGSKQNDLFTGGFTHDNLTDALEAVSEPVGLRFTIKDDSNIEVYDE